MPRIRTLKPEHKQHRKIGPLTDRQYRLWLGMLTEADDYGRLVADAAQLRILIFAYHPKVKIEHVADDLQALAEIGLLELYTVEDTRYAAFLSWRDHQKVDHPTPSRLPEPPAYHKQAIPNAVRRDVARKYGAEPGRPVEVKCHYCDARGMAHLYSNTGWATFPDLEPDHLIPERNGGASTVDNIVLACRRCNRAKGATPRISDIRERHEEPREDSRGFVGDRIVSEGIKDLKQDSAIAVDNSRPPQPSREDQLNALAQRSGLSRDELKRQADDLVKATAATLVRRR